MRVLFIHRSVGRHLIEQGNLRQLLKNKDIMFDDYDNNLGVLTQDDGSIRNAAVTIPGNNTNPDNLAEFFTAWDNLLDEYQVIIIKSCYPNSHIKDETQLAEIKKSYESIIASFAGRNKRLIILTSPPLRPLHTNQTEAGFSATLADWLVSNHENMVEVFDFHHELSEIDGKHKGMLKREYRRLLPFDNHPNKKAYKTIAPKIVTVIERALRNEY